MEIALKKELNLLESEYITDGKDFEKLFKSSINTYLNNYRQIPSDNVEYK